MNKKNVKNLEHLRDTPGICPWNFFTRGVIALLHSLPNKGNYKRFHESRANPKTQISLDNVSCPLVNFKYSLKKKISTVLQIRKSLS